MKQKLLTLSRTSGATRELATGRLSKGLKKRVIVIVIMRTFHFFVNTFHGELLSLKSLIFRAKDLLLESDLTKNRFTSLERIETKCYFTLQ